MEKRDDSKINYSMRELATYSIAMDLHPWFLEKLFGVVFLA
jgi:hypothetical protein